jgi:hypothetical protein
MRVLIIQHCFISYPSIAAETWQPVIGNTLPFRFLGGERSISMVAEKRGAMRDSSFMVCGIKVMQFGWSTYSQRKLAISPFTIEVSKANLTSGSI